MKISKIVKGAGKTINTGDFCNTKINTEIEVILEENDNFEEVSKQIEEMLKLDLDRQEQEILAQIQQKKETATAEIKQTETVERKMTVNNQIKHWELATRKGDILIVSSDANEELKCPRCGRPLQKRNGKYGEFYGCHYKKDDPTNCDFLVNVSDVEKFREEQLKREAIINLGKDPGSMYPSGREIYMAAASKTNSNYHHPNFYNNFTIPETNEDVSDLPVSVPMTPPNPYDNYNNDDDIPF